MPKRARSPTITIPTVDRFGNDRLQATLRLSPFVTKYFDVFDDAVAMGNVDDILPILYARWFKENPLNMPNSAASTESAKRKTMFSMVMKAFKRAVERQAPSVASLIPHDFNEKVKNFDPNAKTSVSSMVATSNPEDVEEESSMAPFSNSLASVIVACARSNASSSCTIDLTNTPTPPRKKIRVPRSVESDASPCQSLTGDSSFGTVLVPETPSPPLYKHGRGVPVPHWESKKALLVNDTLRQRVVLEGRKSPLSSTYRPAHSLTGRSPSPSDLPGSSPPPPSTPPSSPSNRNHTFLSPASTVLSSGASLPPPSPTPSDTSTLSSSSVEAETEEEQREPAATDGEVVDIALPDSSETSAHTVVDTVATTTTEIGSTNSSSNTLPCTTFSTDTTPTSRTTMLASDWATDHSYRLPCTPPRPSIKNTYIYPSWR